MGEHFFLIPPAVGDDYNCKEGHPFLQVTYWRGVLNGFIFSHTTHLPGNRWEIPTSAAIANIAIEPPKCVMTCVTKVWLPQCMSGWMTSLCHVLVINFHTLMEILVKTVKINLKNISLLFDMGTYAYLLNCLFHIFEKGLFVFERSIFDNKVIILLQEWIQFLISFTRKL